MHCVGLQRKTDVEARGCYGLGRFIYQDNLLPRTNINNNNNTIIKRIRFVSHYLTFEGCHFLL